MAETILASEFFTGLVLPFLLVFTLIFAILEKTEVLGGGKRQINAIIGFVVALILIAFPFPRDIIVNLMPLLAVIAVVLLVFMMLYSFAGGKQGEKWMRVTFGILIGLVLVVALLVMTGYWEPVIGAIVGGSGNKIAANLFFVIIIVAAIVIVLSGSKKESKSSEE